MSDTSTCEAAGGSVVADKIVRHLDRVQQRQVQKDTGYGYRSTREVGQVVGLSPAAAKALLTSLAEAGRVRRCEMSNGLFWRSANPLPWEPGGTSVVAAERERELWAGKLTLVVQAVWREGRHTMSRDVKAYPEALRDRALDHVRRENDRSRARRESDRLNDCHLMDGYRSPPSYRLVSLVEEN